MTFENHRLEEEMTFGDPFEDSGVAPVQRMLRSTTVLLGRANHSKALLKLTESCTDRYSSRSEHNWFTEMCSGFKAGSWLRLCVLLNSRLECNKEGQREQL